MIKSIRYKDKPWTKFYSSGMSDKASYEDFTIVKFFNRSVDRFPDHKAFIFEGYSITFKELKEMVDRFSCALSHMGIQKGDSVAILMPNSIPCVVSYYAIIQIGAIAVFNNPAFSNRELEFYLNDSQAKVIITTDILCNRLINLRPHTKVRHIIYASIADYLPFYKRYVVKWIGKTRFFSPFKSLLPSLSSLTSIIPKEASSIHSLMDNVQSKYNQLHQSISAIQHLTADVHSAFNVHRFTNLITKYPPNPPNVTITLEDIAMYQYTGGTTGVAKGVMLTHGNISKQIQQINMCFSELKDERETMLAALPYYHVFGLTTAMNYPLFKGWTTILMPSISTQAILDNITNFKPTFVPLVPTIFINILNHPDCHSMDMTSIKAFFSGSAPFPADKIQEFEKITGSTIIEGFGLTESSPVTHINPFKGVHKIGSVGIPIPDTECRIVDLNSDEKDVPVGDAGELIIRGPQIMKGYLNRPDETNRALRNGWLYTGDIATMDEDGYFYIVDRKKDMIISGGLNVYPIEVDSIIEKHPKVKECCTIAMPHQTKGEAIMVFIVLKQGMTVSSEEIIMYCKEYLATYKVPEKIEFIDEIPKTGLGKMLRKELRNKILSKR